MRTNIENLETVLEPIIDESSLEEVLQVLVNICDEKANHIRKNWQDHTTANAWDKDAWTIKQIISKIIH